jgi:Uma2 family endonuclease
MTALPKKRYTLEEYLELDRTSDEKYEYFDGEVFAMAGGSPEHSRISLNIGALLRIKLRGGSCEAFNSDMRIKVPAALPYRYPDLSVVCGEPIFESLQGQSMLVNPVLLIEVLSPSTTAYALGEKFTAYQSIPTFREYLLLAQTRPHVIRHLYQAPGQWLRTEVSGLDSAVPLETLDLTLPLAEIYERVQFHPEPPLV